MTRRYYKLNWNIITGYLSGKYHDWKDRIDIEEDGSYSVTSNAEDIKFLDSIEGSVETKIPDPQCIAETEV